MGQQIVPAALAKRQIRTQVDVVLEDLDPIFSH